MVSRHATQIFFCRFEGDQEVARIPLSQRLGDVHFGFLPGVRAGDSYGFRAEGPREREHGHRFDPAKLLLDPYATRINAAFSHHPELMKHGVDTSAWVPKSLVGHAADDAAPLAPSRPQFIYEIAVKAFTRLHPGVPPERRGTVAAISEPAVIEHLVRLGADTVELMPLTAAIDERHLPALGLSNAWGYNPVSFMAPDPRLAPGGLEEIRATVEALHGAGIRVVLDMVLNHTGESDIHGATLSFRGLDHALYYRYAGGRLANDTGCGNTLNFEEPHVVQLAMDALRSWTCRTGADGFRFDLATVMGRRATGFDASAPLLSAIEQDPLLSRLIMIAEPWDVGPGGHRLGQFPARWQEWNDRYRDTVRRFWRGDTGMAGEFATRIAGSSDVFAARHRPPSAGINFVAAHDGFTLRDAVTFAAKNNLANGEENRDGSDHEPTWPGGNVQALLATLFLSRGTPMLTAGDEFGRTQQGNNNAYAQDNNTTWLDWAGADQRLAGFTAALVNLRKALDSFFADRFLTGAAPPAAPYPDAEWIGADGGPMQWHDPHAAVLGLILSAQGKRIALLFNRGPAIEPRLPRRGGHHWTRLFCSAEGEDLPSASVAVFAEERVRNSAASDEEIAGLAEAAGIEQEWWEVDGTHHRVSPESLRALLAAMGLSYGNPEEIRQSLQHLAAPAPLLAIAGQETPLHSAGDRRLRISIAEEAGTVRVHDLAPGAALSVALPPGCHRLWAEGEESRARHIIAAAGQCHVPEDLAGGRRVFGLAAHLYALRHAASEGIGDHETLERFAALTESTGGRFAGLNPLHHLFPSDRSRASPYQPSDRHYVDPLYISIPDLLSRFALPETARLAAESRAGFAELERLALVDYPAVWQAKRVLLESAFLEFPGDPLFTDFVRRGGEQLAAHGSFEAVRMNEEPTPDRIAFRAFLQWVAELQLEKAARHGNLYRDLALGCAFDGGEIAADPSAFAAGVSIGAPPDPFSATGQVWNLPPFSPLVLKTRGMEPMRRVISANMRHAAALRIDHVLGFQRQFWVPRGAEGKDGAYVRFPLDQLVAVTALESRRQRCLVVGEDLGTVPEGLRDSLAAAAIFSYRVLWFEREGSGFRPAETYPRQAVACLASHDLPTFAGWRAGRDIEISRALGQIDDDAVPLRKAERARETALLDQRTSPAEAGDCAASVAAHGFLARSPSQVMLVQADDLAGETDPLNVPGTDREWPNWRRRVSVTVEQLADTPLARAILARVKQERPP